MSAPRLAHAVFFTLRDRSPQAVDALAADCRTYLTVQPGIVFFACGPLAADLARPVNDRDFDLALFLVFQSQADHDAYQNDTTHLQFVERNKHNWERVRVFDALV